MSVRRPPRLRSPRAGLATALRLPLVALVLLLAACSSEPTGPTVASVAVTPGNITLTSLGGVQQFSAVARDVDGQRVSGETVEWRSDAPGVASVSPSGQATAVAVGVARIQATVAGVTGQATLTVLPPAPDCVDPETLVLPVGGHTVFGAQECFRLPAGSAGDRYRVVVLRPDSGDASDVVQATLSVWGEASSTTSRPAPAPPSPALSTLPGLRLSGDAAQTLREAADLAERTRAFHERLRDEEARLVDELGASLQSTFPGSPRGAAQGAGAPALQGASPEAIRVNPETSCAEGTEVTGVHLYSDQRLAFYQDSAQYTVSPVTVDQARRMAEYYRLYGESVVEDYFGVPTDIDENGRMVVFITPDVANDEVAAYVWSGDFLPQKDCAASNEGEYIFFNAGLIRSMDNDSPNYQAFETLVHEVKHVVSLYERLQASLQAGSQRFQPTWIEEGSAEIAGNLSSRQAIASGGGPGLAAPLRVEDLRGEDGLSPTPENYGVLLRLVRTIWYLWSQPNGLVVSPMGAHPVSSIYGSGWHFHRWLGDAYGGAGTAPRADAPLFRALTGSETAPGVQGLLQVTGQGFQTLLEEFAVAVALNGTGTPAPDRAFTSYDFPDITDILCGPEDSPCSNPQPDGLYPWPVTEQATERGSTVPAGFETAEYAGPIGPTGLRVHDLRSDGIGAGAVVQVRMDAPGRLVVARLR